MGTPPGIPPQGPRPPYPQTRAQWKAQQAQWKMQSKMQRAAYRAQYRGFSHGSLLGPIFLVLIGVFALLMTTHRIDIANFWHWYGHWWPLVLIAAAHNQINWTAVGDQLNLGDNVDLSQMFGNKHETSEQVVHALPPGGTLVIQNPHGNVTVGSSTGISDGQMHLTLAKTV